MATHAHVTSIEALETFRASLIVFMSKARRSLDDVGDDVRRTRMWIQHDRRVYWETEVRKRRKVLEQAEQELLSAKLSGLRDSIAVPLARVRKAKEAVAEAEAKILRVKRWTRDYDSLADPLAKRLSSLREVLDHDLPQAVAYLVHAQSALDAYAEAPAPSEAPAPPAEESAPLS